MIWFVRVKSLIVRFATKINQTNDVIRRIKNPSTRLLVTAFFKPWHSQDLDFVNANIQHHFHLDDNYFTSQFQRRRWRSYQKGEWEDDGVKIVKLIGQGSFDTLIGEKARKSIVKYMLGILGSISKHCKQACSLE